MGKKIICWDLDNTLGIFTSLENSDGLFQIREGITALLEKCRAWGITQVLTTNATESYAEIALQEGHLREYFDSIFDRREVMAWEGKKYRAVFQRYGLGWRPGRHALVIGDSPRDIPADCASIPCILDSTNPAPPTAVEYLLTELVTRGDHWLKNFHALYRQAQKVPGYRLLHSPDGRECALAYVRNLSISGRLLKTPLIVVSPQVE